MRPQLQPQLAHPALESNTPYAGKPNSCQVNDAALEREDLEAVPEHPDTTASGAKGADCGRSTVIARGQHDQARNLCHEFGERVGAGGHDAALVP